MKQYKVGVVGCGVIASTHLRYLKGIPEVLVSGLCDNDRGRLDRTADSFGIGSRFTDLREMIDKVHPEVVHVLTPPAASHGLALESLKAGMHVMVEKPMARTVAQARELVEAARLGGVTLGVDHSRLRHPCILRAREYLEKGVLGDLVAVEIVQGFTRQSKVGGESRVPWSYTYPWGIYHNLVPHPLYYARAFAGEPSRLSVRAWSRGLVPESAFDEMTIEFDGAQARARILLTLCTAPERNTVTLRGTRATVVVDTNLVTTVLVRDRALPSMVAKSAAVVDPGLQLIGSAASNTFGYALGRIRSYPDIKNTLESFYGALAGRNPLPAGGEDGLAVVEMMETAQQLAESELGQEP